MTVPLVPLLEQAMDDGDARLVLADALEERGEARRAALVRRVDEDERHQGPIDVLAIEDGELSWLGPRIAPLLPEYLAFRAGASLLPLILADAAEVAAGPLTAGSSWRGTLWQRGLAIPTTMRLHSREGNHLAGVLEEDFSRMYPGQVLRGTFHFTGAAVGRVVAFVVSRVEGHGMEGGLYALRLGGGGWLSGSWWIPSTVSLRGELRLRRGASA